MAVKIERDEDAYVRERLPTPILGVRHRPTADDVRRSELAARDRKPTPALGLQGVPTTQEVQQLCHEIGNALTVIHVASRTALLAERLGQPVKEDVMDIHSAAETLMRLNQALQVALRRRDLA